MSISATLGKRLAAAREARGQTQQDVASALEVHPMRVSNWERGVSLPSAKYEQPLADHFYGGDLNALYGLTEKAA